MEGERMINAHAIPWAEITEGCPGGEGRSHPLSPRLRDFMPLNHLLPPFPTCSVGRWEQAILCKWLYTGKAMCAHVAPLRGLHPRAPWEAWGLLTFSGLLFLSNSTNPWFDLWFVHMVIFGARRGFTSSRHCQSRERKRRLGASGRWELRRHPTHLTLSFPNGSSWQRHVTTVSKLSQTEHPWLYSVTDVLDEENSPSYV